jgi:hypothetical protein
VIDLFTKQTCLLPLQDFLEPRFAGDALIGQQLKPQKRLRLADLDCHVTSDINIGDDLWYLSDVCSERGLLLFQWQHYYAPLSIYRDLSLVADKSWTPIRRFPLLEGAGFLDHGRFVCGARGPLWHETVDCIDSDIAQSFLTTRKWNAPRIQTAINSRRVIISDYRRKFDWIDWVWRIGRLKDRTIWDFATAVPVVSWHPKMQGSLLGPVPFEVAISPDGQLVAEGGEGILTLYEIEH